MSSIITFFFAPSFLLLIHYFEFRKIVLLFVGISFIFLIYAFAKKKKFEDFVVHSIYLILLGFAYIFVSIETVKFIPVFTSMAFFSLFAESALHNKELIYRLTQKFYKKKLSEEEVQYLKRGDAYWAFSIFIYMLGQVALVFYASDTTWAFYSSVGWYIYFVFILGLQIIYGKAYVLKVSS